MPSSFGVVDLFAGPGGLGEGFASIDREGHTPYRIAISVENEKSAHRTLRLRAFLRQHRERYGSLPLEFIEFHAGKTTEPVWSDVDEESWKAATAEARFLELGHPDTAGEMHHAIKTIRDRFDDTILIGGPPCQAYSLVGRSRAKGKPDYVPEDDGRHYLFRDYIQVLKKLRPAAFVMENVKGMLSSTVESRLVFEMLMEDLSSLGATRGSLYELRALRIDGTRGKLCEARQPSDFVVRSEALGVPQRRHRVFIIGLRSDVATGAENEKIPVPKAVRPLSDAISNLPPLRSGLSRCVDSWEAWQRTVSLAARDLARVEGYRDAKSLRSEFRQVAKKFRNGMTLERSQRKLPTGYGDSNCDLRSWLENRELRAIAQHETRTHMASDLSRYLFAAVFARVTGTSPKAYQYPQSLTPNHRNWHSGAFSDRFRVQLPHQASTTVTSHMSKDGHYYIHHEPLQCRSLTVREAARLQTFPDDYLFLGNRTQQYIQVGNAVPPYLARKIALLLLRVLERRSAEGRSVDDVMDDATALDSFEISSGKIDADRNLPNR